MNALYTFRWNEGGFNQVWARSKKDALERITREFPRIRCDLTPNLKSFKRLTSKKAIDAYYASIPYMD
jgi:hypothetical protein